VISWQTGAPGSYRIKRCLQVLKLIKQAEKAGFNGSCFFLPFLVTFYRFGSSYKKDNLKIPQPLHMPKDMLKAYVETYAYENQNMLPGRFSHFLFILNRAYAQSTAADEEKFPEKYWMRPKRNFRMLL